jgi:cytochrome b pre-mRNA-processing protein 3
LAGLAGKELYRMALAGLFRKAKPLSPAPLYMALVGWARTPWFYTDCAVADSVDGRFDMMTLVVSLALLRLERDGEAHRDFGTALIETYVADMDESLRESGVGDLGVGKQVRKMAEAFVGRYGAYRAAAASGEWQAELARNVYRGADAPVAALAAKVAQMQARLNLLTDADIVAGNLGDFA